MSDDVLLPRVGLYLNGSTWVDVVSLETEQTAYNHGDTAQVVTYCNGSPDYGALSQAKAHIPYVVKIGAGGTQSLPNTLFSGYLDEIDTVYDEDTITLSARGLLSLLIDVRTSQKPNQNVDVGVVIRNLINSQGLQANVGTAGVLVGKLLRDDNITTARNVRIMDYISTLANGVGWETRVLNGTVIVGPPATSNAVPTLQKQHGKAADLKLSIKHSALHAHNITVKFSSYIPKKKAKTNSNALTAEDYVLLNGQTPPSIPNPTPPSKATGGGTQSGGASVGANDDSDKETYIFANHGWDAATCDKLAALIQADLSRHEFIMEMQWAPTASEIATLCQNGTETLIRLSGCSQSSHNQTYHPKRITWNWSADDGLTVNILAVNHVLPQDTGSLPNS